MDEFSDDIQKQEAYREMAKLGLGIFRGLREDGASPLEASLVLSALFAGMMSGVQPSSSTDEPSGA
jgi:hypothetical protein